MFAGLSWKETEHHGPTLLSPPTGIPLQPSPNVRPDDDGEGGVYVSPARQQLIGVRTTPVSARVLTSGVRATGTLAYDETRVAQVHTKIAGWIDQLFVDFVGKPVQKGQPLFTIYSPDLVATQQEYLLARRAQAQLGASQFEETRQSAASLLAAARKRLELWDVSPAEIADLERTGEPRKTLTVYAPANGIVLERNAFSGQYITPETSAFKLADLSTIWVIGQVFESDLSQVHLGDLVTVELTNAPGVRSIAGHVSFIYPDVDSATRRARFRAEIPNPGQTLKPDMFVTVSLQRSIANTLAVPAEAVIDTGVKQYVIVARGNGYFDPRIIQTGPAADAYYPVIGGLAMGEQVVTSAQFLIDSETNLQAAMQAMADLPGTKSTPVSTGSLHVGHGTGNQSTSALAATIELKTDPSPVRVGDNTVEVVVKDPEGQLVSNASVSVLFFMAAMPSMSMPAMRLTTPLASNGNGVYRAIAQVPMAGQWQVTVSAMRGDQRVATKQFAAVVR
jgi:RND family efflux transporter MFP subunit